MAAYKYKAPKPHVARLLRVIESTNLIRGDGTDASPRRAVVQYWSLDGKLLAEVDTPPNRPTTSNERPTPPAAGSADNR